mgnify:CR=1 FL=1
MTRRPTKRGRLAAFSVLISSIFCMTPTSGAANKEASYSLTQAAEGRGLYARQCASCHGMNLLGNESGPTLSGKAFQDRWASRPVGLAARDYAVILAYMLYQNGFTAGAVDLDLKSQLVHSVALGFPSTGQQPPLAKVSMLSNTMTEWLHHRGTPHSSTSLWQRERLVRPVSWSP